MDDLSDSLPLPQTQAEIDQMPEAEVRRRINLVAGEIPVDRYSHPQWVAKEESRLLGQRLAYLQAERVETWTKDVRDMTASIRRLTIVNVAAAILAVFVAFAALAVALHVDGIGR